MNTRKRNTLNGGNVRVVGILIAAIAIIIFSEGKQNPNNMLTGRWLLKLEDAPNAMRYVEFSPSGNVTCYKMDGKTVDSLPGYSEKWTVRENIIECVSKGTAPARPLLTRLKDVGAKILSGDQSRTEPTRYAFVVDDHSNLQLELLDSSTEHRFSLKRVSASKK